MKQFDDLIAEFLESVERGEIPDRQQLLDFYPEWHQDLSDFFKNHDRFFVADSGRQSKSTLRQDITLAPTPAEGKSNLVVSETTDSSTFAQRTIGGYEIVDEIDRGGMGIVYRAKDLQLDRTVALKMIRAGRMASESDVQRFRAEAQAAAKLDHPGIVPIYEVGTHQGQPYFSMAFIEGAKLDDFHKKNELSVRDACQLVRDVAIAIDHAHQNGLVHRDVKPANILIDQAGRPRVTDFGLAKNLEKDDGLTSTGEILGSINYMAPEQASARGDLVDRMTDVYSLGAVLYYLCTGQPPFETDNPVDTLLKILDAQPVSADRLNPELDAEVAAICMRCLEKEPKNRYLTAAEFANEIDRYLKGEPVQAMRSGIMIRIRQWSRQEPGLVGHLVGLGLIEITRGIDVFFEYFFSGQSFHSYLDYSVIIWLWLVVCLILQRVQNRIPKQGVHLQFAWSAADLGFLTWILLRVEGNLGPLFIAFPLVVVVSGLFLRVNLVAFSTILSLISFEIVFLTRQESGEFAHYGFVGAAAIVVIGTVVGLMVHRIRLLNRLFE
ncbi:serine/threonine protein kinase [Pirellulaceae bacterium]|jgi:eukaryotic-like serine/threonine-protein kinase|nr:serine/threonine protein kinase [Pirellulaceae bacterium]